MHKTSALLLLTTSLSWQTFGQNKILRVYADQENIAHVVLQNGKNVVVAGERGKVGIGSIQIAKDRQTAGWLVLYGESDRGSSVAGTLVLWQHGKVLRRFQTDQMFWSWAFYIDASQVAYHVGPMHGEARSHCELHEVVSGRLLESWDGDLEDGHPPSWAIALEH